MNDLALLRELAARHRAWLAAASLLLLAEAGAALAVPWAGGRAAAALLEAAPPGLHAALAALLAALVLLALLRAAGIFVLDGLAHRIGAELRVETFEHLQSLPLAFHQQRKAGDTLALLARDAQRVGEYLSGALVPLAPNLAVAAGAAALMLAIRADLALLAIATVPLLFLAMKLAGRRVRPLSARLQDEEAEALALAQEGLEMLPAVKSSAAEAQSLRRYREQIARVEETALRERRVLSVMGPAMQLAAAAGLVALLAIAASDHLAGRMEPAALASFLLYALVLARPVGGLADLYGQTQAARAALARLARVKATAPESAAGRELDVRRGEIVLAGVRAAYPGRGETLKGIDLRIEAGEWVAITGPNGAGKSTLAHLLARLVEPAAGRITVDGADIAQVSLPSLRRQVALVPQQAMLFHGTVRDNIALAQPGAQAAGIEAAARLAQADEFVRGLPQGYATVVGDRGVRLSGGQQQKIALARALLKDAPILILDEATAMFDPGDEERFLRALRGASRSRTVVLITHRPAAVRAADRVLHLEDGRIARIERNRALRAAAIGEA